MAGLQFAAGHFTRYMRKNYFTDQCVLLLVRPARR